jgi:hypothetical protein
VGYRADSRTWGQHTNLNCHTHWGMSWPGICLWETKGKTNNQTLPNQLVRLWQSISLNTNTRIRCWRSNTRTQTKTEILLFLNLEFFICLFVCSVSCLFISPHWFLWVFFFVVVSFTIVN